MLYVHGGPAQGCWDFMGSVGDLLAEDFDVVATDQPGVLRSDPLPADVVVDVDLLLASYEDVRRWLGIERWVVVGHSVGGGTALDYALARPEVVRGLVLDNPCLDADLTDRWRLPQAARLLRGLGREEAAGECERIAALPGRLTGAEGTGEAMQALGEHYMDLFFADTANIARYAALRNALELSEEQEGQWKSHLPLVSEMYRSRIGRLAELTMPSLLLLGESDLVAPPPLVERYRADVQDGRVVVIGGAGHFTFVEQPTAYVHAIREFVAGLPD